MTKAAPGSLEKTKDLWDFGSGSDDESMDTFDVSSTTFAEEEATHREKPEIAEGEDLAVTQDGFDDEPVPTPEEEAAQVEMEKGRVVESSAEHFGTGDAQEETEDRGKEWVDVGPWTKTEEGVAGEEGAEGKPVVEDPFAEFHRMREGVAEEVESRISDPRSAAETVEELIEKARWAWDRGSADLAAATLITAFGIEPENAEVLSLKAEIDGSLAEIEGLRERGEAAFEAKNYGGAKEAYEEILRRFPGNRDATKRLEEIDAALKRRKDRILWIVTIGVAGTLFIAVAILGAKLFKGRPGETPPRPPSAGTPATKKTPEPPRVEPVPPPEEKVEPPAVDEKEMEARLLRALERKAKGDWQRGLKDLRELLEVPLLAERVKKEIETLETERRAVGEAHEKAGELEKAAAVYQELEAHFPEKGYGSKAREVEYGRLLAEGEEALEIGETDRAMELLGRAASLGVDDRASRLLEKTSLSSWRETAERFERTGYWVGAEFYYKKILEILKDDEAIQAKVTRLRKLIRYDEAFARMDEHFAERNYDLVLKEAKIALGTGVDDGTVERVQAMIESIRGMIFVPAGPYDMGDEEGSDRERPVHAVDLPAFSIMMNEVTVEEYSKFLLTPAGEGHFPDDFLEQKKFPDRPVVGVTLEDAKTYAKSRGLTLPTEAQWERAARGTERKAWPWGDEFWENMANTKESMKGEPAPVEEYKFDRSPIGALNMGGNVAEWTLAPFAPYPGGSGEYPEGQVVIRGGDFTADRQAARGASRRGASPDAREKHIGFRCVRTFDFKSLKDLK